MSASGLARVWLGTPLVLVMAMQGGGVQTQEIQPVNSGANPYRTIRNWSRTLAAVYVYFDNDQAGFAAHNALELRRRVAPDAGFHAA